MSGGIFATIGLAGRGGEKIAHRKTPREKLNHQLMQAAIMAVERLQAMIRNEEASNGDVIKASSLIFDRLDKENGEGNVTGDYEIVVRDGS